MVVVALMAAVLGGYYFAFLVAAAATGMFYEWMRIVRGWGLQWSVGGFFYCLLPALALLWIRDRSGIVKASQGIVPATGVVRDGT